MLFVGIDLSFDAVANVNNWSFYQNSNVVVTQSNAATKDDTLLVATSVFKLALLFASIELSLVVVDDVDNWSF